MTDPIVQELFLERRSRRMTQSDLARRIGVAWWEIGDHEPQSLKRLRAWADALGYDLTLVRRVPIALDETASGPVPSPDGPDESGAQ